MQFAVADAVRAPEFIMLEDKGGLATAFVEMAIHTVIADIQLRAFKPADAPCLQIGIVDGVPSFVKT